MLSRRYRLTCASKTSCKLFFSRLNPRRNRQLDYVSRRLLSDQHSPTGATYSALDGPLFQSCTNCFCPALTHLFVTSDRIVAALADIGPRTTKTDKFTALGPGAIPPADDTPLGRLTSYGLGEGAPAIKRSQETGLTSAWEPPLKQARQTAPDSGIPLDPGDYSRVV